MKLLQEKYFLGENGNRSFVWASGLSQEDHDAYVDQLDEAIDHIREGEYSIAAPILRLLIKKYKFEALDAYHHLSLIKESNFQKIRDLQTVMKFIDKEVVKAKLIPGDEINYGILANRPFHRLIHGYSTYLLATNNENLHDQEILKFLNLAITTNPNDNLGCRYLLTWEYIRLKMYKDALTICKHYNREAYIDGELLYAAGLSSLKLSDKKSALIFLKKAKGYMPIYAHLLKQHSEIMKKYISCVDGMDSIISGSIDESMYLYSHTYKYWEIHLDPRGNLDDRIFLINAFEETKS